jgi:beta-ureidopropionase
MNTRARIATVCQAQRFFRSAEENRAHVLGLLDLALRANPDLVCLPENFATVSVPDQDQGVAALAEPVPGPTVDAAAERARRGRCYVICPLLTRQGGLVYNSAVVLDRAGQVLGIYDKRRPVTSASDYTVLERGVTPGAGAGVFDLDFGRIGIRICFDVGFPEDWQLLAEQGVRLALWPSAYDGGGALPRYAALHRYYVVTSVRTDRARILDPCGAALAQTDRLCNVAWQDINLDFSVCHYDFNFGVPDRLLADLGDRVQVRSHLDEGVFLVEPTDPSLTIEQLRARYGFEDIRQYHDRHRAAYAARARGQAPPPQPAAHGDRPLYAKGVPALSQAKGLLVTER